MGKILFICTDGTWNTADQKDDGVTSPSNVAKMARIILSTPEQLTWYDEGVGTRNWLDKITGGAFGHGLYKNVQEAYRFVMEHYQPGDKLVLFGFSRGAYTARSLAGLIGQFGILRKKYISKIEQTYELYRSHDTDPAKVEAYRERYSHVDRDIHFVGVWDTVGALGIPLKSLNWATAWRYKFHDTKLSPHVKHAFHAVAVDEKRRSFAPTLWQARNLSEDQVVEQRWFAGVHSNIGGSYKEKGLSDITLDWMLGKLREHLPGMQLDEEYIERTVEPDYKDKLHESRGKLYISSWINPYIRDTRRKNICNQVIDETVYQRVDCERCNYKPINITRS